MLADVSHGQILPKTRRSRLVRSMRDIGGAITACAEAKLTDEN
jgi:hypothetical protein